MLLGMNGKGGSGTFVRLKDGQIALLTAKHVVIECIRNTGEILVWAPLFEKQFRRPIMIRMDSSQQGDAALVTFENPHKGIRPIPFKDWTQNQPGLEVGSKVLACGYPAALRDIEGRKITPKFGWLRDRVISLNETSVVCGIDESMERVETYEGLSGGGLFSEHGKFLGVIIAERRRIAKTKGELHALRPRCFPELYTPFSFPPDAPKGGYHGRREKLSLNIFKPGGTEILVTVGCLAELMQSKTAPNHRHGRIGRLLTIEFIFPNQEMHYPININSLFTWSDDSEAGHIAAIRDEFKFLLMRMGWLIASSDGDVSTIQISPMG